MTNKKLKKGKYIEMANEDYPQYSLAWHDMETEIIKNDS